MISVILAGGLGNQLFQYAAARHVAHRLGTGLVLDVRAFSLDIYERSYALAPFRLAQDVILLGDPAPRSLLRRHPTLRAVLWRIRRKVLPRLRHRLVSDRGFRFDPMLLEARDGSCLEGEFQSERYFGAIAETIRADLGLLAPATGANAALLSRISAAPSVCVHFRVGHHDGTAKRTNRTLGTLPLEYYARALEQVASNAGALELFVFADDMAWAREQVRFAWPTTFVDVNDGRAAHEDLRLMSCCRHFIIANSALSWWAAWLSRSPRKIVCAPQRWFADGSRDTSDLIPEGWLRL